MTPFLDTQFWPFCSSCHSFLTLRNQWIYFLSLFFPSFRVDVMSCERGGLGKIGGRGGGFDGILGSGTY